MKIDLKANLKATENPHTDYLMKRGEVQEMRKAMYRKRLIAHVDAAGFTALSPAGTREPPVNIPARPHGHNSPGGT